MGYFKCDNNIFTVKGATRFAKLVYGYLCRCANKFGRSFPSHKDIAEKCSISVATVKRAIENLIACGLLNKECRTKDDGAKTSNLYTVIEPVVPVNKHSSQGNNPQFTKSETIVQPEPQRKPNYKENSKKEYSIFQKANYKGKQTPWGPNETERRQYDELMKHIMNVDFVPSDDAYCTK